MCSIVKDSRYKLKYRISGAVKCPAGSGRESLFDDLITVSKSESSIAVFSLIKPLLAWGPTCTVAVSVSTSRRSDNSFNVSSCSVIICRAEAKRGVRVQDHTAGGLAGANAEDLTKVTFKQQNASTSDFSAASQVVGIAFFARPGLLQTSTLTSLPVA